MYGREADEYSHTQTKMYDLFVAYRSDMKWGYYVLMFRLYLDYQMSIYRSQQTAEIFTISVIIYGDTADAQNRPPRPTNLPSLLRASCKFSFQWPGVYQHKYRYGTRILFTLHSSLCIATHYLYLYQTTPRIRPCNCPRGTPIFHQPQTCLRHPHHLLPGSASLLADELKFEIWNDSKG